MKRYIRAHNKIFDTTLTPCKELFPYDSYDKVPEEYLKDKCIQGDTILDVVGPSDLLGCTVDGNHSHVWYLKGVSLAEKYDYEHVTELYIKKGDDYICVAKRNRNFILELKKKKKR